MEQQFSTGGDFASPRDICEPVYTFLVATTSILMLSASIGCGPRMLQNSLQGTDQTPTTKHYLAPNVKSSEAEKTYLRERKVHRDCYYKVVEGYDHK